MKDSGPREQERDGEGDMGRGPFSFLIYDYWGSIRVRLAGDGGDGGDGGNGDGDGEGGDSDGEGDDTQQLGHNVPST